MTRRILLCPASDRDLMRKVASRLDQILGFPRTLAESEITRTGPAAQRAPLPYIETAFAVWLHNDTGATILHGAIGLEVNGRAVELGSRFIEHNALRKRLSEWIADQGWEVRGDLPGNPDAWTRIAPRDGAAGSADGEPIPEGSE